MQGFYPITARTSTRRRSSSSSSIPVPPSPTAIPLSPLRVDPHYSNILTESPQSTSTSTVHPYLPVPTAVYSPRTPLTYGQTPPSDVDANTEREFPSVSQSSRRGLLPVKERDYAEGNQAEEGGGGVRTAKRRERRQSRGWDNRGGIEEKDTDEEGEEEDKYIFVDPPENIHPSSPSSPILTAAANTTSKAQTTYLPRPGPADSYLSQFLFPIPGHNGAGTQPPSPEPGQLRPSAPIRALSAPGIPQGTALPSPILSPTEKNLAQALAQQPLPTSNAQQGDTTTEGPQPIFKIFSAGLDVEGEEMVRRLKEHLGEVLRVQEEVGGMHLRLEGLGVGAERGDGNDEKKGEKGEDQEGKGEKGVEGEVVDRREKGVEEIMDKLGALSQTLRTYHHLGTPKLHFPAPSNPSSAFPNSPLTPTSRIRSPSNPMQPHPLQSPPTIRSPPKPLDSRSPPDPRGEASVSGRHLKNKASIEDKRVQRLVPTSPAGRSSSNGFTGTGQNQKHSPKIPSNLDQVTTAEEEEEGEEEVYDRRRAALGAGAGQSVIANQEGKGKPQDVWVERTRRDLSVREGFTSSPMEMADRSRPW